MKSLILLFLSVSLYFPVQATELPPVEILTPSEEVEIQTQYFFYNFGRTRVNTTKSARFYIRNQGRYPIYFDNIDTNGDRFRHEENCPGLLWPGERCTIRVYFRPNQAGLFRGEVYISLIGTEDIVLRLRGRGVWGF